jgi:26S proteasome regulatory subunit N5
MADAALKPEKDFSKEADKQIPEAEKLAKVCISCSPSQLPRSNQY